MENSITFISIVLVIWGILEIILFFKVWMMTDNVEKLKNRFIEGSKGGESELFVNMDIIRSVRALYYLNQKEEAYELLNKYLYYKLAYFAQDPISNGNGKEYTYINGSIRYKEEWHDTVFKIVTPLYKELGKDIPDNLLQFNYDDFLNFGKK
jgi:hypothetical protein